MKRAAAVPALAVAFAVSIVPAAAEAGVAASADVAAAAKALIGGQHVYVAPGGPELHSAALTSLIGTRSVFVVAVSAPDHATDWLALLSTATRISGTYLLLNDTTLTASSNTFPAAGVDAARAAATKAHPTDPAAAVDDLVNRLLDGDAALPATDSPKAAAGDATSATTAGPGSAAGLGTAAGRPRAATSAGASPLLLLLLLPILGGVAYAVTRARRRTG